MVVVDLDGRIVEGASARPPIRPATSTSTAIGRMWAASSTRTRPTPQPSPRWAGPSRSTSPRWPMSSAGRSAGFALIGGEEIGKVVVEFDRRLGRLPAQKPWRLHHRGERGGRGEAAVMTEDVARTVWLALQPRPAGGDRRRRTSRSCTTDTRMSTGSGETLWKIGRRFRHFRFLMGYLRNCFPL